MGGHVNYNGELHDFSGAVPPLAATSGTFQSQQLSGRMAGIAAAAAAHAQDVLAAEQYVTQANDGLQAYKSGADKIHSAYNGTDAQNAAALQNLTANTVAGMLAGSPKTGTQSDMPGLAQLNVPAGQG